MRKTLLIVTVVLAALAGRANGSKIADITRLNGQRTNKLTGLGLVYGLKGTGDGGDYAPAIRPLAAMLGKFADKATAEELSSSVNVAVVALTATVPSTGALEGDHIDVRVASLGKASSLAGGRLFVCPMTGPVAGAGIFALADGPLDLEDPSTPNVAVVHGGATMEVDLPVKYIENGRIGLILETPSANWTTAHLIAKTINGAESLNGEEIATAVNANLVVVDIPQAEREHPDSFISRIQQLPVIMLPTEARVVINRKTKTLIVTGDVEISPVVISHKGLTIDTTSPAPVPRPGSPIVTTHNSVALDTTNQGGARLQDLVTALEQLRVPVEDRITIVKELYDSGKLHAKLIEESQ
ncbi:MAG TPA: flagellar basal body P-ring protein FlgI [Tepidisphaeraceae bacterium]|jgi:flagellar P-ring protein precursor FlgI|nr:flagellar basal body P-ring protein FlgI [Tepidisphaeraceae bacterium]